VLSVKAKELAPNQGELPLFTELPRRGLLGNLEADGAFKRLETSYMRLALLRAKCYDA
jgi:hypothetical protein